MRHRNAGYKLGRNTSHRRAMLRNLVTSVILNGPHRDHHHQVQSHPPPHRKDDHPRQAGNRSRPPSGRGLPHDARVGRPSLRNCSSRVTVHATADTSASRASEPAKVTQPRWPTSSFSEPSTSSTRRPRSAPKPAPRSVKSLPSRWKSAAKAKPATPTPKPKLQHTVIDKRGAPIKGAPLLFARKSVSGSSLIP